MKTIKKKKKVKGEGTINVPLYDLNKNIIAQMPQYDFDQIRDLEKRIDEWNAEQHQFFMLLCREINYYTVFQLKPEEAEFRTLGESVTGVLTESEFNIHSDEQCDDHFEIWGKKDDDIYDFLLFPYDQGVVKYG